MSIRNRGRMPFAKYFNQLFVSVLTMALENSEFEKLYNNIKETNFPVLKEGKYLSLEQRMLLSQLMEKKYLEYLDYKDNICSHEIKSPYWESITSGIPEEKFIPKNHETNSSKDVRRFISTNDFDSFKTKLEETAKEFNPPIFNSDEFRMTEDQYQELTPLLLEYRFKVDKMIEKMRQNIEYGWALTKIVHKTD